MSNPHMPVQPVTPPAPWIGGKRNLAARICRVIAAIEHDTYAEPFMGMGGVFFSRRSRPPAEFINDVNRELTTLFRVLQRHHLPFIEMLRFAVTARDEFDRLKATDPATLTDMERAARFLYLQRTAFGGKVDGQNFGVSLDRPARFDVTRIEPMLADLHDRLAGVTIENLPYSEFIARYDAPATLFYLDPPYWNSEADYGRGVFAKADFGSLAGQLAELRGGFLLSINDVPEIREIFASFHQRAVTTTYTVNQARSQAAAELLITNRPAALDAAATAEERQSGFDFQE